MFARAAVAACLALACLAAQADLRLRSMHALVVDEETGEVLLSKNGETPAPIASLTKLLTAMVVIDAQQDAGEPIRIDAADQDRLKHTRRGLPVGAVLPRGELLELSLIASDNRATSALARHYPGGLAAFHAAVDAKIAALGLAHTAIEEPTGLSPRNRSSAEDMVQVLRAAAAYPEIARITSKDHHVVRLGKRRVWRVRNTNRFVGAEGWNISLSKTGFTREAGRCLTMRLQEAGRTVMVVLMGAVGPRQRAVDALNIRRWLAETVRAQMPSRPALQPGAGLHAAAAHPAAGPGAEAGAEVGAE
jgi:D-alanyl-D-alanine carboxypeptidase/D-alanyl-D-alanine endopeptidase (penicillin-binding protein 7)